MTGQETDFFPKNGKTPSGEEGSLSQNQFSLYRSGFIHLLSQTGLFPVGGILVQHTLGSSLVNHG